MKEKVVYMLAFGILTLLGFIIIGDFIVALEESRPVDDSIVNLLQLTITGLIGIIGTYFGSKTPKP
jgi:sulfite exporter TauE/SafE